MSDPGATRGIPQDLLLVEDNMIIALDTAALLKELNVGQVRSETDVSGALAAIDARVPDFALLDFNLGEETSKPIARKLNQLKVRFYFATGYDEQDNELQSLGSEGVLSKPYSKADLARVVGADFPRS
ncbi:response regulator [Altererythrobacter aquiaggeris]|uniref:response regulator n=1 Tax=Aestuarierythrobacter aquiaggeris TaxID=1898396 RepID=UPI003019C796